MIQPKGTGTPPDTTTDEPQPGRRHGVFAYEVPVADRGQHRASEAEAEVAS